MSKIYTKTGDKGETGLVGGQRVRKSSLRVEAYGTIDELNSHIGLLRAVIPSNTGQDELLGSIQHRLFSCSSYVATPVDARKTYHIECGVTEAHVSRLEEMIDRVNEAVPPFKAFVLPGGSHAAAVAHICRTVTRRTERALYRFIESDPEADIDSVVLRYINRLSDYLFVVSRAILQAEGLPEVLWDPKSE